MNKEKKIIFVFTTFMIFLIGCNFLLPKVSYIENERRYAEEVENLSVASVLDGSFMASFEKNKVDLFPFRNQWQNLKKMWCYEILHQKDVNGVFKEEEHLFKIDYPYSQKSVETIAKKLKEIFVKNNVQSDSVYYSLIPDKGWYASSSALKYNFYKMEKDYRREMVGTYIPIVNQLSLDSFYKTDPHWKQEKLGSVVKTFSKEMNFSTSHSFTSLKKVKDDFAGVYAGQYGRKSELDSMYCVDESDFKNYKVYDWQSKK